MSVQISDEFLYCDIISGNVQRGAFSALGGTLCDDQYLQIKNSTFGWTYKDKVSIYNIDQIAFTGNNIIPFDLSTSPTTLNCRSNWDNTTFRYTASQDSIFLVVATLELNLEDVMFAGVVQTCTLQLVRDPGGLVLASATQGVTAIAPADPPNRPETITINWIGILTAGQSIYIQGSPELAPISTTFNFKNRMLTIAEL